MSHCHSGSSLQKEQPLNQPTLYTYILCVKICPCAIAFLNFLYFFLPTLKKQNWKNKTADPTDPVLKLVTESCYAVFGHLGCNSLTLPINFACHCVIKHIIINVSLLLNL